jgi:hypothetical protein
MTSGAQDRVLNSKAGRRRADDIVLIGHHEDSAAPAPNAARQCSNILLLASICMVLAVGSTAFVSELGSTSLQVGRETDHFLVIGFDDLNHERVISHPAHLVQSMID